MHVNISKIHSDYIYCLFNNCSIYKDTLIVIVIHHHFFSYIKTTQNIHNILTVNNKIPISCKLIYWPGQQFIDLLPAIELLTDGLIFICSISHMILTSQCRSVVQILGLDGRGYWKHLMDMWVERVNKKILKKMKMYNKTVINRLLGLQQFCLTLERICCPQPAASGNRSVLGSNKTAVVLEPSQ